jgi:alpha/beta superfamily hydrolase
VVTDVRPVFPDGPEAVRGAMIVHSLKLSYLHNNESEEFFVAMDDDDLASLQKAVSRAEAKSKTLKGVITKAEMVDLDQK